MLPTKLPEYHTMPSDDTIALCGPARSGKSRLKNSPVDGVKRAK
jgi:hypothetical protein